MNQPSKPRPLALSRPEEVVDLLNRQALIERLTGYIDRLQAGAVLAIDAPWGEGKTWFGRAWSKHLKEHQHKVVWIDAFAQDYMEDPFMLITAEIAELMEEGSGSAKELRKKASSVMKAILPVGAKALINIAGRIALGSSDLADDFQEAVKSAGEDTADATSKWIENKLEQHAQEKASLEHFKTELSKFASHQQSPIVIFIDELDRCRPTFAVQLIERVKHFFEVPNLVFVLLLNRDQLQKAVRGVYGDQTDASTYLGKFIHLFLRLPKNLSREIYSDSPSGISAFVGDVLNRYGFDPTHARVVENFRAELSQWAVAADMSLRDIERGCALFVMANAPNTGLASYLIMHKIKHPDLYLKILRDESAAHVEAAEWLSGLIKSDVIDTDSWPESYFGALRELHQLKVDAGTKTLFLEAVGRELLGSYRSRERAFQDILNRIDLPVEDY